MKVLSIIVETVFLDILRLICLKDFKFDSFNFHTQRKQLAKFENLGTALSSFPLFCWYKWKKRFLWYIAATQTAKNQLWMRVDLELDRTVQITVSDSSSKSEHLSKVAQD